MKMRNITLIKVLTLVVVMLGSMSCFKDEVQGTLLKIEVYSKNVKTDDPVKTTTELRSYAFNVKEGSKWEVATWEDALAHRITNITNPDYSSEQREDYDVLGTFDAEAEYQVELDLRSEWVFMLVVDPTNEVYATRLYETPINLPVTPTSLHIYASNTSGSANGWDFVNPFPDKVRESLITPDEEEEEPTDDEPTDDEPTDEEEGNEEVTE